MCIRKCSEILQKATLTMIIELFIKMIPAKLIDKTEVFLLRRYFDFI